MPLAFKLPDDVADIAQALRDIEQQLPKPHRALILQAANELTSLKQAVSTAAEALELAASLKAGQMSSQSRCDEIADQVRRTLVDVAANLRALA